LLEAGTAKTAIEMHRIKCALTHDVPKSAAEPPTLVHRLEFNDHDTDRVRALFGPLG
jgi:hypothetical protein